MLIIRLKPQGRKYKREYRVSVFKKTTHTTKKAVEDLGYYNPYSKHLKINADRLKYYTDLNIQMSDTVSSLLKNNNYIK